MELSGYIILSGIIVGALYLIYRTMFKKAKCSGRSESGHCSVSRTKSK